MGIFLSLFYKIHYFLIKIIMPKNKARDSSDDSDSSSLSEVEEPQPKKKKQMKEKNLSDSASDSDSEAEKAKPKKKKDKKEKKEKKAPIETKQKTPDGDVMFQLGGNKYVTARKFKAFKMVDIREYYFKDGKELPGKKVLVNNREKNLNYSNLLEIRT